MYQTHLWVLFWGLPAGGMGVLWGMGEIQVMSDKLASQVAAGEVVERPESVVRELVDNALDAGARRIEVRVEKGGTALISVGDDGRGMAGDDAVLSLERHATSKLRRIDDLQHLRTLGFRGEALPSIASVSRFRLRTRLHGAVAGTLVEVEGGVVRDVREDGCAPGTQVEVRQLFFNVPARRKFLRSETTEFAHIDQRMRMMAAGHPEVGFVLFHDGREVFRVASGQDRRSRVRDLLGPEIARVMVPVGEGAVSGGAVVEGLASPPGFSRPTRRMVLFFVNGRPVESPVLRAAVTEAYAGLVERGSHPACVLFLELDPAEFDINVHPAKKEIRFRDPRRVQGLVEDALGEALRPPATTRKPDRLVPDGGRAVGGIDISSEPSFPEASRDDDENTGNMGGRMEPVSSVGGDEPVDHGSPNLPMIAGAIDRAPLTRIPGESEATGMSARPQETASKLLALGSSDPVPVDTRSWEAASAPGGEETPSLFPEETPSGLAVGGESTRYLGNVLGSYEIFASGDGLLLMERRAAVERILFEWLASHRGDSTASQALLLPVTLALAPQEWEEIEPHLPALREIGLGVEPFGPRTVLLTSLPALVKSEDPGALARLVLGAVRSASQGKRGPLEKRALLTIVSRELAGGGRVLPEFGQGPELLRRLLACEMPYCCPRGRATLSQLGRHDLARRFGLA